MADFVEYKTQDLYREHELHDKPEPVCSICSSNRPIACGHGTMYPLSCSLCNNELVIRARNGRTLKERMADDHFDPNPFD